MKILFIGVIFIFVYWFLILKPGKINFWKIISKYPDIAYDFFQTNKYFKIFNETLPDNYKSIVPKKYWTGPFRLWVPKINKMVYIFGKYPEFETEQEKFLDIIKNENRKY